MARTRSGNGPVAPLPDPLWAPDADRPRAVRAAAGSHHAVSEPVFDGQRGTGAAMTTHAVAASSDAAGVQPDEGGSQPTLLLHFYPYLTDDGLPVIRPFQGLHVRRRPRSPREMRAELCDVQTIISINRSWHSVLPNVGPNFGVFGYIATYLDVIYASALWSRPIAANRLTNGFQKMELRRMAVGPDAPTHTASWFLSVMSRLILARDDVAGLLSYQATDVHRGTMYRAAGWRSCGEQEFVSWNTHSRRRPGDVNASNKVRWERP